MQQVQYPNLLQDTPQYAEHQEQLQQPEIIEDDCIIAQKLDEQQHQIQVVYNTIPEDQLEDQLQNYPFISDLPFGIQKIYLLEILGLYLAWSSIHFSFIYIYLLYFDYKPDPDSDLQVYESLIPCGCIMMILFTIAGLQKIYRQFSAFFLLGLVLSYSLAFCSFYQLMNQQWGLLFFLKNISAKIIVVNQIQNFWITIILIISISLKKENLNIKNLIIIVCIIVIPISFIILGFFIVFNFSILYTFLLLNSLKQILNGRYQLRRNEIFVGVIGANFGTFMFCQIENQ